MSRIIHVIRTLEPLDICFLCAIALTGSLCIWLAVR